MKVIHVDMDQFFATVEQLDQPELKGKLIAVGHDAGLGVSNQKEDLTPNIPRWIQLELEFKDWD